MKLFEQATRRAIQRHMQPVQYSSVVTGSYDVETQTVTNTEVTKTLPSYPRHVVANQYNFPNLVAGNIVVFYFFAGDFTVAPKVDDKITFETRQYTVRTIIEHRAEGKVLLYKCATSLV